jgi:small conductance mechanosensitive channel
MSSVWNVFQEIRANPALAPFLRIAVLLFLGLLMELAVRLFLPRITARVNERTSQIIDLERRQRSATVVKFGAGVLRVVLWAIIFVSLLGEININIGPLLAGAGVVGAGLALGAQNIIKDYLAGFFILLENQYTLGDVVRIGTLSGTVEEISMRITILRDEDGAMHVIPNGTIQSVSNMTSVWARAVIDVDVRRDYPIEQAFDALAKVGKEIREDRTFGRLLLEAPQVLGVVSLSETTMRLRLAGKVIPEEQWKIRRELLKRIKIELDSRVISASPPAPAIAMPVAAAAPAAAAVLASDDLSHAAPPSNAPPTGRAPILPSATPAGAVSVEKRATPTRTE